MSMDIQLPARIKRQRLSTRDSSRPSRSRRGISGSSSRCKSRGSMSTPAAPCQDLATSPAPDLTVVLAKAWPQRCINSPTSTTSTLHSIDRPRAISNADILAVSPHQFKVHKLLVSLSNSSQGLLSPLALYLAQDLVSRDAHHLSQRRTSLWLIKREASALKLSTSTRLPTTTTRSRRGTTSWHVRQPSSRTKLLPQLSPQLHPMQIGHPTPSDKLHPAQMAPQPLTPSPGCIINTTPTSQHLTDILPLVAISTQACRITTATVMVIATASNLSTPCHLHAAACTAHQGSLQ